MLQAVYAFFDAAFILETDSADFLAYFDRAYSRLRTAADPRMPIYQVHLSCSPQVDLDGLTWRTDDPAALALYAHSAILNAATARVRSHFLFHAAALAAPDGAVVILASRAGLGKTTLALALLT